MALAAPEALRLLTLAHAENRLAHGWLITGPEGSGKRWLATEFTRLLLGVPDAAIERHPDVCTVEPESKSRRIRVDQIRGIECKLRMHSLSGGQKVAVLFDADCLMEEAANALLKTLEEPPGNSRLILTSTQPDSMLETILSRCLEVPLQLLKAPALSEAEAELLAVIREYSKMPNLSVAESFQLVRAFQSILARRKESFMDEEEKAYKKEETSFKQMEAKISDTREDFYKARGEARYLGERSRLLSVVERWWSDILRLTAGGADVTLELPEVAAETSALAGKWSVPQLLGRMDALAELRQNFSRNVQEQLAIECAFLKAFTA